MTKETLGCLKLYFWTRYGNYELFLPSASNLDYGAQLEISYSFQRTLSIMKKILPLQESVKLQR